MHEKGRQLFAEGAIKIIAIDLFSSPYSTVTPAHPPGVSRQRRKRLKNYDTKMQYEFTFTQI